MNKHKCNVTYHQCSSTIYTIDWLFKNKPLWVGYILIWSFFFAISCSFHCEIAELMIDTQGSEWRSKDGEMKIDKCALLLTVCGHSYSFIWKNTQIAQVSVLCCLCHWRRNCLRKLHLYNSSLRCHFKQTGPGTLQIYLEQSSFSQPETRFQLKPVQNHTAMFRLYYSAIEL